MPSNKPFAPLSHIVETRRFFDYQVDLPGGKSPSHNDLFVLTLTKDKQLATIMMVGWLGGGQTKLESIPIADILCFDPYVGNCETTSREIT
jgi:hypothetical protein